MKGPGSQHAPFIASLGLAFIIGIFAQRSRFCTMGAFRDLFLFRYTHLFLGLAAMFAAAFIANALTGGLKFGFEGQPVAHSDFLWNYLGMVTAGLAFALAGGCPGRQLFMAGEGDSDAGILPSACWSARLWPTIWARPVPVRASAYTVCRRRSSVSPSA